MNATAPRQTAGPPVRKPRLERVLRVAALTALLVGAPILARSAVAQRPASVRASAYVTHSIIAVALRPASAGAGARVSLPPFTERLLIRGVGTLDVQAGPGEAFNNG